MKAKFFVTMCVMLLMSQQTHSENPKPGKFFFSTDHGKSWSTADSGFPNEEMISAWVNFNDQLIAGTSNHGVYAFDAATKQWYSSNKGLPLFARVRALAVNEREIFVSVLDQGLYVSSDGGANWKSFQSPSQKVRALFVRQGVMYAGADEGIFRMGSTRNAWTLLAGGIQANDFAWFRDQLYVASNRGIFRSPNDKDWEMVMPDGAVASLTITPWELGAVTFGKDILVSDATGREWMKVVPLLQSQYTFQLTPTSSRILIEPWMTQLPFLRLYQGMTGTPLPQGVPFNALIPVKGGMIVVDIAGNKGGC